MIRFEDPYWLLLLLALPLLALWWGKRGASSAVRYSTTSVARLLVGESRSRAGRWMTLLRLLVLALFIVGLARPQVGHRSTEVDASGIDILLAIDVSTSMDAMDFSIFGQRVDRLHVVKKVVAKFVEERPNDRIGLVGFAGRPYMLSPLTLDHDWLLRRLDSLKTGMVEDGTAIGSAIATGVNRLRKQESKSKILILLTDGMNNSGKIAPATAAEAARALGIKIYTIGAGTKGEAPMPTPYGGYQMVSVDIDEQTLTDVARMTGAQYFRATDTDSLESIYEEINQMEATTRKIKKFEHFTELFGWAVIPGVALLGLELFLSNTRYRRLP